MRTPIERKIMKIQNILWTDCERKSDSRVASNRPETSEWATTAHQPVNQAVALQS